MQRKLNTISHIAGVIPLKRDILLTPRRSYAELQQALQQAEQLTEQTLLELKALRQTQLLDLPANSPDSWQIQHQLQFMVKQGQRYSKSFAVLMLELDHYQAVLKEYGTDITNQINKLMLARMAKVLRGSDSINQQADGQFLLLITDVSRLYDVVLVAEKLLHKLGLLTGICPQPIQIAASIGISRFPEDGLEPSLLVERATAAMRHAQSRGGSQFSFLH